MEAENKPDSSSTKEIETSVNSLLSENIVINTEELDEHVVDVLSGSTATDQDDVKESIINTSEHHLMSMSNTNCELELNGAAITVDSNQTQEKSSAVLADKFSDEMEVSQEMTTPPIDSTLVEDRTNDKTDAVINETTTEKDVTTIKGTNTTQIGSSDTQSQEMTTPPLDSTQVEDHTNSKTDAVINETTTEKDVTTIKGTNTTQIGSSDTQSDQTEDFIDGSRLQYSCDGSDALVSATTDEATAMDTSTTVKESSTIQSDEEVSDSTKGIQLVNTVSPVVNVAIDALNESNVAQTISRTQEQGVIIVSDVLLTTPQASHSGEEGDHQTTSKVATSMQDHGPVSSLSLLAQYDSDVESDNSATADVDIPDTDSVVEVPVSGNNQDYRQHVVTVDSDVESISTDSVDSDSPVEYMSEMRKMINKSYATVNEEDEDDDDEDEEGGTKGRRRIKKPPRVKGELLLEDLPPIEDLHITVPEEECVELGRVHSIVEQLVLVSALPNSLLLNLDTVLFLEKGKRVLGGVFDVLGQVADPLYCVRFNTHEHISERGIQVGDVVYVAPKTEHTQFVILSSLMRLRGSDASWENDVEPPARYLNYSDDEEERSARAKRRGNAPNGENDLTTKWTRTDDTSDTESVCSVGTSVSSVSTATSMYGGRGAYRRGGRGRGQGFPYRPQQSYHYNGPTSASSGYAPPNFNAGSWHSNYYPPPYPGAALSGYPPTPLHHHPHHHQPPHLMYNSPHPPAFMPYVHMPPPTMQSGGMTQPTATPSMYMMNPYGVMRPSVLPTASPNGNATATMPPTSREQ